MNSLLKKIVLALALTGCNGPSGIPDFTVDGVDFYINSTARVMQTADIPERFDRVLRMSADYWGRDIKDMQGWRVIIVDGPQSCGLDFRQIYGGCTDGINHLITLSTINMDSIERLPLPHEMGHVFNFDSFHTDRKFREFKGLWEGIFNVNGNPTAPNDPGPTLCPRNNECVSVGIHNPEGYEYEWNQPAGINNLL